MVVLDEAKPVQPRPTHLVLSALRRILTFTIPSSIKSLPRLRDIITY